MPTFSEQTLSRLLDQARVHDNHSISMVIQGYERWAHAMTPSIMPPWLRQKEDPADIAQQALLAAYRGLPSFSGSTEPQLLNWLTTIIERKALDAFRRYKTDGRNVDLETDCDANTIAPEDDETPSAIVRKREAGERTWSAVENLPERQRHVIELAFGNGLDNQQIASRLGVSADTVRKTRSRSIARLRRQLPEG